MQKNRISSVDVLRGITIAAMILVNTPGDWGNVYAPLLHAQWHGYTPTDLVFPFFLFIVGCSIAFSYNGRTPSGAVYGKISVRALKLIALGLFLGAFTLSFPFFKEFSTIRFPGVLQRIGLVFFFAAIIALNANWKALLGITGGLLLGYWAILGYVSLPDGSAPSYERVPNNWAMYIDKAVLGSHTYKEDYDPEGLLSTIPSIASALIGVLIGRLLLAQAGEKTTKLLGIGAAMLVAGTLWSFLFPINKALWTSSFVLVTAGWATLFLAVIYYLLDVRGIQFGETFRKMGANALILYFLSSFISKVMGSIRVGDTSLHGWLYQTIYVHDFLPAKLSSLLYALTVVAFYVLLGLFLYRRRIFIKV
ncbi:heparan-alpha-glucosaminide N-acetyltransferase [Neolewinella lacunae]|uniref:Heparan-alpha-glucosaminide N-acetyltransferase n=1 Tax=Neolewinella lacunae TaxID=1517758 RepID=A0A923PRM4_9BACT|nr:heparan-alpha-glucosaminide N-acetyltransferase domain-containing protein [Neolewinella lacunae]MBC6996229.1 heparan-alpha-glucosaminide N-acetyltransferase [Neolewinella lacunae]MDN3634751.1 heparan-alpha-glucosaminide N-acetyltransferase [Neolewinella lacunae]